MRKLFVAGLLALSLAGCASTIVSPVEAVTKAVCTDGTSVAQLLKAEQDKFPTYGIFIENAVAGEKAATVLAALGARPDMGDTVTALTAIMKGEKSGSSLVVVSKNGCVVGQKFFDRAQLVQVGLVSN